MYFFYPGSKYESVHRGSGPTDPKRPEVCGNNGGSAKEFGEQIQRGRKWTWEQPCQAVQGTPSWINDMPYTTPNQQILHFMEDTDNWDMIHVLCRNYDIYMIIIRIYVLYFSLGMNWNLFF